MKTSRHYKVSKLVYVVLLEVSLVVDIILALSGYEYLKGMLNDTALLALGSLFLSSVLGIVLYLVHIWQMEYLTRGDNNGREKTSI